MKLFDNLVISIAREKIERFNPRRYCIFSSSDIDETKIIDKILQISIDHGCELIVNGTIPTLKYYLRLISSLEDFVSLYSNLVREDTEIQLIHKKKWQEIIVDLNRL